MTALSPFEVLYDRGAGKDLPLPRALARVYGRFRVPRPRSGPLVLANLASTLDGVVDLGAGRPGGGDVSGHDPHDRMLMGLLRATADAVVVGAGTLRAIPKHRWTPEKVFPDLSMGYAELRARLGLPTSPLTVIVSGSGDLDLSLPTFQTEGLPVLVVTTRRGAERLSKRSAGPEVRIAVAGGGSGIRAGQVVRAVSRRTSTHRILVEGGPHLLGTFLDEGALDELFLTLAPQVAGRAPGTERPGLVAGHTFGPERPRWGTVESVRRSGQHLFLRYRFPGPVPPRARIRP